ncbi:MAG: flippase-like domain-containing protein [Euryarchaeota archaeon]|nr:flippase-like domain-containing protein [Euryarchaeota archaeon]
MKWLARSIAICAIISVFSTVVVLLYTSNEDTLPSLCAVKPVYLLAAVLLHTLSYGIWGFRISVLCRSLGERVGIIKSTEVATSSLLMMAITPSSAGGEPVMVYMLTKEGITLGKSSAIVVAGRLFDAILLLFALPLAIITLNGVSFELDILLIAAALTMVLAIAILWTIMFNHGRFISAVTAVTERVFRLVGRKDAPDTIIRRIEEEIIEFKDGFITGARGRRSDMLLAAGATILFWTVEFMLIPLILYGLNVPDAFSPSLIAVAFAAQVIISIVMVVPLTPGASGIAELSSTALLATFIPLYLVGIVVICWRAVTYYLNVIVGAFVSIRIVKNMDYITKRFSR